MGIASFYVSKLQRTPRQSNGTRRKTVPRMLYLHRQTLLQVKDKLNLSTVKNSSTNVFSQVCNNSH